MSDADLLPRPHSVPHLALLSGPFSHADAAAAGLTRARIRTLLASGAWIVLRRGVFCDATVAAHADPMWLAAAAALAVMAAGTVVSHETAACLHDLPTAITPDGVWLTRRPTSQHGSHRHPGIVERAAAVPPEHRTTLHGLPVTTVARTVVDLARHRSFNDGVVLTDTVLHHDRTTTRELIAVRDACACWPGIRRATRVLDFANGAAESPLESLSRLAFARFGLPAPSLQALIRCPDGARFRADFLWALWRVIGEADGRVKYERADDLWREKLREDRLREMGFEVVRWTWDDIANRPERVVARIRQAAERANRHR